MLGRCTANQQTISGWCWNPTAFRPWEDVNKPRFETTSRLGFPKGAQALYCSRNNKITFLLDPVILSQAFELFLFQTMAPEYGHHPPDRPSVAVYARRVVLFPTRWNRRHPGPAHGRHSEPDHEWRPVPYPA